MIFSEIISLFFTHKTSNAFFWIQVNKPSYSAAKSQGPGLEN